MNRRLTFLCISCEFKGKEFISALHTLGHRVYLVTAERFRNENWPYEHIEEAFYMPDEDGRQWNIEYLISGTAHIFRQHFVDKIIALDDYDVSKVALLREEFRSPGMGQTTGRHFFDKLAMRMIAKENDIRIPRFTGIFNDDHIRGFFSQSEGPWLVKPRMDAGALGIRKLQSEEDFWRWNADKYEQRHKFLIEEYKPGAVYHVDALFKNYKSIFTRSSQYLQPPYDVAHGGGVFRSHTLDVNDKESKALEKLNNQLLRAFKLNFGASHSEFIRNNDDGEFYFLETSARVGGAHLADMVEAATGLNLWAEWARLEASILTGEEYELPDIKNQNAGILTTLSRFEYPDYSAFDDPAICWRLNKKYHIGLIFRDDSRYRILELLDQYTDKIRQEYHTTVPLKE
ncbi:MAG TPA: ATPase [Saprospiraceae bacterium]|nr:ATPase [Saprospiraceae bacterium]